MISVRTMGSVLIAALALVACTGDDDYETTDQDPATQNLTKGPADPPAQGPGGGIIANNPGVGNVTATPVRQGSNTRPHNGQQFPK